MRQLYKVFALIICYSITSCDPEYSYILPREQKCWEQLIGHYTVYDTANNVTYSMQIQHKDSVRPGYATLDSLIITNYGNKFNLRVGFVCQGYDRNVLFFGAQFPSYDHNGKRWSLSLNNDDTTTLKHENQLNNDTIILYFNIDNIAFYAPDGVPYYSADEKHIAVKQH